MTSITSTTITITIRPGDKVIISSCGEMRVLVDEHYFEHRERIRKFLEQMDRVVAIAPPVYMRLERCAHDFEPAPRYLGPSGSTATTRPHRGQARACRMDRRRWKRRRFLQSLRGEA